MNCNTVSIHHLKEVNSDQWYQPALLEFFGHEEASRILQIKPGGPEAKQGVSWIHTPSGNYSIKSGYRLWNSLQILNGKQVPEQAPNFSNLFVQVWNTSTSLKLKNFLWRCLRNAIPVGTELYKKRIATDSTCLICGSARESFNHLLFICPFARSLWMLSPFSHVFFNGMSSSLYCNFSECMDFAKREGIEGNDLWPLIIWRIWKMRNELNYQNKQPDPVIAFSMVTADAY